MFSVIFKIWYYQFAVAALFPLVCFAGTPATAPADEAIRELAHRSDLRLSSEDAERKLPFSFVATVSGPQWEVMQFTAECSPRGMAIVGRSPEGPAYAYATDGLVAKIDSAVPGGIIVSRGAAFSLVWKGRNAPELQRFDLTFDNLGNSRIDLDIPSLLASALPHAKRIVHDAADHVASIELERFTLTVAYDPTSEAFPIRSVIMEGRSGMRVCVSDIRCGATARVAHLGFDASTFLALPLRNRVSRWTAEIAGGQTLIAPKGYWADKDSRRAGLLLAVALCPFDPSTGTTQPAEPDAKDVMAKALTKSARAALRMQFDAASAAEPSDSQIERLRLVHRQHDTLIGQLGEAVRRGMISRNDAPALASDLIDLAAETRAVLTQPQFAAWANSVMASETVRQARSEPLEEACFGLPDEIARLNPTASQAAQLKQCLSTIHAKFASAKNASIAGAAEGAVNADETWKDTYAAAQRELIVQLLQELRGILTREQYLQLEKDSRTLSRLRATTSPASVTR
jgi:hypothetical protein